MRIPTLGETELLAPLQDGALDDPPWRTFLTRLRGGTGAGRAALIFGGNARPERIFAAGEAAAGARFEAAASTAAPGDPVARMREGRVYAAEELFAAEMAASGDPLRALRLADGRGGDVWLALAGGRAIGPAAANLLVALVPHLRAALHMLAALEAARAEVACARAAAGSGWLALDAAGRVLACDAAAEVALARGRPLRRGAFDRLSAATPALDRRLTGTVEAMARDPLARPQALMLARAPETQLLLRPWDGPPAPLIGPAIAVLVVLRTPGADKGAHTAALLAELYGLTASEARLAQAMAAGGSIAEAGAAQGLTRETARNYSKKIYAKTGARGQADLVRRVLAGVAPLG